MPTVLPSSMDAIFLDVGNTLRMLVKDEQHQRRARQQIAHLAGTRESPETFCARLDSRYKEYRLWAFENLLEAPETELWTRWMLPDYPAERIAPHALELTFQYRQSMGRRVLVPDAREVIVELSRRGYCLGIISNVITSREIPDWLDADHLTPYFKSVVLSSVFGRRKPDPAIYLEAARLAEVDPGRSVYVGDNPIRDVEGTHQAGFGMVVLILEKGAAEAALPVGVDAPRANVPDCIIRQFNQLLDIFPPR
jgi:HAD superfamily hydrolase (TIGR01549 family)